MSEKNLSTLLSTLDPKLLPGDYVFCHLPGAGYGDLAEFEPIGAFVESEGLTLILAEENARSAGLTFSGIWRLISLDVHSSLEAVGLTAAIATALTRQGISANVVAAYHHDHLFVPTSTAQLALNTLVSLQSACADDSDTY